MPAKNHWTLVDTASEVRPYCCPTASLIEIDDDGQTISHKWFMISGQDATATRPAPSRSSNSPIANPRWRKVGSILQPLSTTKAVLLPDGKVLIGQGVNRSRECTVDGGRARTTKRKAFTSRCSIPATARHSATREDDGLARPAWHGDAAAGRTVFFAGENREALVRPDDPSFPLMTSYAGVLPRGDPDLGVPVGQIFSPPYLFKQDGSAARRPVIGKAPERDPVPRNHFDIKVAGPATRSVRWCCCAATTTRTA